MKAIKILAFIFIVLGMITNFFTGYWLFALGGIIIDIWALATLGKQEKNTVCGVLALIFGGFLGGLFYLIWDGEC